MLKKIVSFLLASLFVFGCLSGCAKDTAGDDRSDVNMEGLSININNPYAFATYNTNGKVYQHDREALEKWRDYMSEQYGINVNVTTDSTGRNNSYGGFTLATGTDIYAMRSTETIVPLTPYLKNNKAWNALPEEFRRQFEIGGEIWAIPYGLSEYVPVVGEVSQSWLNGVGGSLPDDLGSYANLAALLPNGGERSGITTYNLTQIFHSYGLYVAPDCSMPYSYDPELGCIADALFKPEALSALTYIHQLLSSGTVGFNLNNPVSSNAVDSVLIPPLSQAHPVVACCDGTGYVLLASTSDPQKQVNTLCDLLFSNAALTLDCNLGLPENYVSAGGGTYVVESLAYDVAATMPNLGGYPQFNVHEQYRVVADKNAPESAVDTLAQKRRTYIERYEKSGQLIKLPMYYYPISGDFYLMRRTLLTPYTRLFYTLRNPSANVAEALKTYRIKAIDTGIEDILRTENQMLGLPQAQTFSVE
ncbi:MAG: hypothetical protein IJC25_04905 [Clostridia bacterium]|nr:hypothetical protein [Clostridia bacterium]